MRIRSPLLLAMLLSILLVLNVNLPAAHASPGVTYQNKSEATASGLGITISAPAGFSAGDLFVACVVKDDDPAITPPSGWTVIQEGAGATGDGQMYFWVGYRIAQSGDTSWSWTGDNEAWYGVVLRFTGHAGSPIYSSGKADGDSEYPTAPDVSYTDLPSGSLCLQVFGADGEDTPYTTPGQLVERFNNIAGGGSGGVGSAGGDKSISGTGSTGTAQFTMAAAEEWVAVTVVIKAMYERSVGDKLSLLSGTQRGVCTFHRTTETALDLLSTMDKTLGLHHSLQTELALCGEVARQVSQHFTLSQPLSLSDLVEKSAGFQATVSAVLGLYTELALPIITRRTTTTTTATTTATTTTTVGEPSPGVGWPTYPVTTTTTTTTTAPPAYKPEPFVPLFTISSQGLMVVGFSSVFFVGAAVGYRTLNSYIHLNLLWERKKRKASGVKWKQKPKFSRR